MVFNTVPYTVLPDNSILITANMQFETGFPSSHQLKSYVASKSRLKLAARAVLSADAGLLVILPMTLSMTSYMRYLIYRIINKNLKHYMLASSCVAKLCDTKYGKSNK